VKANGISILYIKATEGTGYLNPYFAQQYDGSYNVGLIRGSYHFARPDVSGGEAQADYFIAHGGGWSADGKTLPSALDIDWHVNSHLEKKEDSRGFSKFFSEDSFRKRRKRRM
jgi:lysozyme